MQTALVLVSIILLPVIFVLFIVRYIGGKEGFSPDHVPNRNSAPKTNESKKGNIPISASCDHTGGGSFTANCDGGSC